MLRNDVTWCGIYNLILPCTGSKVLRLAAAVTAFDRHSEHSHSKVGLRAEKRKFLKILFTVSAS